MARGDGAGHHGVIGLHQLAHVPRVGVDDDVVGHDLAHRLHEDLQHPVLGHGGDHPVEVGVRLDERPHALAVVRIVVGDERLHRGAHGLAVGLRAARSASSASVTTQASNSSS